MRGGVGGRVVRVYEVHDLESTERVRHGRPWATDATADVVNWTSSFPEHGDTAEDVIHATDLALYAAKAHRRNAMMRAISVNAVTAG
jgi:hypothetical protein